MLMMMREVGITKVAKIASLKFNLFLTSNYVKVVLNEDVRHN